MNSHKQHGLWWETLIPNVKEWPPGWALAFCIVAGSAALALVIVAHHWGYLQRLVDMLLGAGAATTAARTRVHMSS